MKESYRKEPNAFHINVIARFLPSRGYPLHRTFIRPSINYEWNVFFFREIDRVKMQENNP